MLIQAATAALKRRVSAGLYALFDRSSVYGKHRALTRGSLGAPCNGASPTAPGPCERDPPTPISK